MRILISGAGGVIGTRLVPSLKRDGHEIIRLTRKPRKTDETEVLWDPGTGAIDQASLEKMDAVIHLAGESIAGIWTEAKKKEIRDSRVRGTSILTKALEKLEYPPKIFLCASAIGYYGDRGDEQLTELSHQGAHLLSQVCQDWEKAARPAASAGIRVAHLRFGIVLSSDDRTLQALTTIFTIGLGTQLGDGENYISWITVDDAVRAIKHVLLNESLEGPVNIVSPHPARQRELVAALGETLSRPTLVTVPESVVRALFGSIADTLLLSSMRVDPSKLRESGFQFRYPRLKTALRHIMNQA